MTDLLQSRAKKLFFYSPYNFVRVIKSEILLDMERKKIQAWLETPDQFTERFQSSGGEIIFFLKYLKWDTAFFNFKTVKLSYCLFNCTPEELVSACRALQKKLKDENYRYCFIEIPSEDIELIQGLTSGGFKLVETRLTYFNDNLADFKNERFKVRKGTVSDIPNLRNVASFMRNDYDRFHADPVFDQQTADSFLSTYIEEALKGFSDVVLVPDAPDVPADSFLTANYNISDWEHTGVPVSKMVLSAVSSETNKGWYIKLISEMTYHLREKGAQVIYMNTQSTNRAVFRTWEKLGYQLGSSTHVLSVTL